MTISLGYKAEKFKIDSNNISKFILLENKRKLRENKVNNIKRELLAGHHFSVPIVINELGSTMRVIDGMHRITAVEKAIVEDPNLRIEVELLIYKELTDEQEKEVFKLWNIGTKQSSDDYIAMYKNEIPILTKLQSNFPAPIVIYKESNKLHFKLLTGAYIAAKNFREGGYSGSAEDFVNQVSQLDLDTDYEFLFKFVKEFMRATRHEMNKEQNHFLNTSPFNALIYLYYWNVEQGNISSADFWNRFKKIRHDHNIHQLSLSGGIGATKNVQGVIMQTMNRGLPLNKYLKLPVTEQIDIEVDDEDEESN